MPARKTDQTRQAKKAIFIVDDHPVLRRGLAALIESEPDLAVCGQASTCQAALQGIRESKADLVIVDLGLEGCDGLDLVKDIKVRHPKTPALVLSMHDESLYAERALRAGARGYVTKQQLDDTVLIAVRRLLNGEMYMSEKMEARFAKKFLGDRTLEKDSPLAVLTDRELAVFRLIGQGRSTRQIAQSLHLSIKTIESHRGHIKQKLMIESSAELAITRPSGSKPAGQAEGAVKSKDGLHHEGPRAA
ncbi:MAG: response regulator transcription factor [Deltaproteobacteria bacterium]|nr:response regulator transcription factor [Deltaproteobacteria bacterium]